MPKKVRVNIHRGGKRVHFKGLAIGTPCKFFVDEKDVMGLKLTLNQIGLREERDYELSNYVSPEKKKKEALEKAKKVAEAKAKAEAEKKTKEKEEKDAKKKAKEIKKRFLRKVK